MLIKTMIGGYTPQDAQKILINCDSSINIVRLEEIYYPYRLLCYSLEVGRNRLSKLNKIANCIIDLVQGTPAEGKGTPSYKEIEIRPNAALDAEISKEQAYKVGHDFVFKLFLNKAKLLHTPEIKITDEEFFYKKFYIVHCKDPEERDYFIMVDSMDGGLSILDYKG